MISIIICSKFSTLNKAIQKNIYDIIGCKYIDRALFSRIC